MPKTVDKKRISEGTENKQKAQKKAVTNSSVPSKSSRSIERGSPSATVSSVIKNKSAVAGKRPRSVASNATNRVGLGGVKLALEKHPPRGEKSRKTTGLTVRIFDIQGRSTGTTTLPKEIFGQKPNSKLLAQSIRVYQANTTAHTAHTKTRGEVRGGGKKPWQQKGTGRARAGSIRSPLWRGGGIVFGPRYRNVLLTLPKKMKHKALVSALSDKAQAGSIRVISGIEKISPKTKVVANLLKKLETQKSVLLVISQKNQNVNLASRNIPNLRIDTPPNLNAYEILKNRELLISKEALALFK